ncbi:MAG: WD40 repeat domain-containing protein [Anaerolineales bacterium]
MRRYLARQLALGMMAALLLVGCRTARGATQWPQIEAAIAVREQDRITRESAGTVEILQILDGHGHGTASLVFLPDEVHLATFSGDRELSLWDSISGERVLTQAYPGRRIYNAAFSSDGAWLAVGNPASDKVELWETASGRRAATLAGHAAFIMRLAFSPDSDLLASADDSGLIKVWSVDRGDEAWTFQAAGPVGSLAFSPDGRTLASGTVEGRSEIELWDLGRGERVRALFGHSGNVYNLAFSPDGSQLASSSGDMTVRLWDALNGEQLAAFPGHRAFVYGLAFSPDGTLLASSDANGLVKLWDVEAGRELRSFDSGSEYLYFLAFSPGGRFLAAGGAGSTAFLLGRAP